ncbi:hypothetical protein ACIOZL_19610 [Streptomyces sp. NPDC087769]|uniref:hypothetical protein n=1 Tax=Streptomyces sp. NPDC087769 TaxID=3365802 RepID=UPI003802077B
MNRHVPPPRRITRDEIDAALFQDHLHRRARAGSLTAIAAVTGLPPDALYAEAISLGLLNSTNPKG